MSFGFAMVIGGIMGCFYLGSLMNNFNQLYTVDGDSIRRTINMLQAALWAAFVSDLHNMLLCTGMEYTCVILMTRTHTLKAKLA